VSNVRNEESKEVLNAQSSSPGNIGHSCVAQHRNQSLIQTTRGGWAAYLLWRIPTESPNNVVLVGLNIDWRMVGQRCSLRPMP